MHTDVDPYAFCERKYLRNAGVHAKLRKVVCKRTRRYLWTPAHMVTFVPALSNRLYGDGKALLGLTTINSRPRFYILRIDSKWSVEMDPAAPDGAEQLTDRIDAFAFALEEEFGRGRFDDDEPETEFQRVQRRKWPAYDDESGCSWWRMDWPLLPGVKLKPHPFNTRFQILG